jgi:polysaccharide biosynthesis/export protein
MNIFNRRLPVFVFIALFFSSCLSRKNYDYFQSDASTNQNTVALSSVYEPKVMSNDILNIQVASINPDASKFFNPSDQTPGAPVDSRLTSYLVDLNGEIEMPLIGKIKVAGLTTREIRDTLRLRLEKYLESPTLKVNFESFKVTILGEVKMPGLYNVLNEKISITDALGMAGDLTIYGDRQQVMIVRERDDKKEFHYADLTKRDVFTSDVFYLHPGDVVYVPAGKGRIAAADTFYRIAPLVISTLTLLSLIFFRINN